MACKKTMLRPFVLIAAVLAGVLLANCATNPVSGRKDLTSGSRISNHAEAMLRLINDKCPLGEPALGEKVKIFQ